ncbi:MAG: MBL fold metallo-hydrolase [Candidatus Sphingomonas colombiensis]|nr:MBL fold metallo-hydrolase [Sphingomonas sp.]WEK43228.1 MAG: MBL fold metallo-hydrolase [Sphingomonas sp.]
MPLEILFHGAAGAVTGSCMELRTAEHRVLVDCGLFQGARALEALNYEPLPFDPRDIDLIILTHAHLDHSGRLGLLMREGCHAGIWCTPPNRQLLGPLLTDAAKLQAADAERRNERPDRAGLPAFEPLYDFTDVERVIEQLHCLDYGHLAEPSVGLSLRFWDAHHILGAASVELHIDGQKLLFSGDIGPEAADIGGPAAPENGWDHVICESTYGDRDRVIPTPEARRELLGASVEAALARGGNLIIPAFALERTQMVIEDLVALFAAGRIKPTPVFVDAPLADKITQAYRRFEHPSKRGPSPFDHPQIHFTRSVDESKKLNRISGAIIIAGSGMCNGGRVRHHLLRNLPRGDSTVLLVGYQARGTLGAVLQGGAEVVRISGNDVRVRARIETIDAYSGHADHAGLLRWLGKRAPIRGGLFLDHGEPPALARLAADAGAVTDLPSPIVPALGERFTLKPNTIPLRSAPPRVDADRLVSGRDWRSRSAAIRVALDARLRALTSDAARDAALASVEQALAASQPVPASTDPIAA